jgi:hypothetical protein
MKKESNVINLLCIVVPAVVTIITNIGSVANDHARAWFWATIAFALITMASSLIGFL